MTQKEIETSLYPISWERTDDGGYKANIGLNYDLYLEQMPNGSWGIYQRAGIYNGSPIGFTGTLERAMEIAREYQVMKVCDMFNTKN